MAKAKAKPKNVFLGVWRITSMSEPLFGRLQRAATVIE
jgi:hypothetical protein